jgi:hypothetical protein
MQVAVHRQAFVVLPAPYCADAAFQVRSDLLPGIETVVRAGWHGRSF